MYSLQDPDHPQQLALEVRGAGVSMAPPTSCFVSWCTPGFPVIGAACGLMPTMHAAHCPTAACLCGVQDAAAQPAGLSSIGRGHWCAGGKP